MTALDRAGAERASGTDPILSVQGLSVTYLKGGTQIHAVDDVSFELGRGERLAIIGESGSGKSTITQALLGVLPNNAVLRADGGELDGVGIFGDLTERQWNELRRGRIAYVPQDPNVALDPVVRIGAQIEEAIRWNEPHVETLARAARAAELLDAVGIDDVDRVARAYPHQVSGGQRQRVLIAIALVGDPEVIVADEPTSGLDVAVQKRVLDLLDEIVERSRVAIVLITHDLAVAAGRSDRILVLEGGRIVEQGPSDEIVTAPEAAYTRRLLDSVPVLRTEKLAPTPGLPAATVARDDGSPLVVVDDLHKTYVTRDGRRGKTVTHATRGVSLTIDRGTTYGLVGESGSGKSTIARIVAGIDRPDAGAVTISGGSLTAGRRSERRTVARRVQYVFQNPYGSLDPRQTIREIIAEPIEGRGEPVRGATADARIREVVDAVGLPADTVGRRPTELSGGQRQRVAIARGIVTRPELLVLDEPVSALDVSVQAQILQLLIDLQHEFGTSYLFISHDLAVVSELSDRIGVLHAGELVDEGSAADVLGNPTSEYTRTLLDSIPDPLPA
ncbi:peptide/nickel transport system ATP-binding protein [Pseudoclavibacter chungangensis]|uniref:dipeptide ABC transporter ATP-binding protein n=1 Tax=Pseudoclavibacter chungangensis TaxID=587635 RepID=UPI00180829E0|nr:ABC transporter ATP-binding protein [Pseudoclavibacter chungangensis]NYJ67735.1 peptide/nickel transport system ATP-binding protein [Pseudoclavibacter chungangensis]